MQNPALVPCVVFEVGPLWVEPRLEFGLAKSSPLGDPLTRASVSLLLSLFPGKLSKNWLKVSAGVNCDRLRRLFFFSGDKLSNNSLLTVNRLWTLEYFFSFSFIWVSFHFIWKMAERCGSTKTTWIFCTLLGQKVSSCKLQMISTSIFYLVTLRAFSKVCGFQNFRKLLSRNFSTNYSVETEYEIT